MATARHLSKAPIAEALFDVRVTPSSEVDPAVFKNASEELVDRYPEIQERRWFEGKIGVREGELHQEATDKGVQGYFFRSKEGPGLVQFRVDGFTYNHLRPYSSWDEICPEAMRTWEIYRKIVDPLTVTRIGVRYINHIPVRSVEEMAAALEMPPMTPKSESWAMTEFLNRSVLRHENTELCGILTLAYVPKPEIGGRLVVDVDAFLPVETAATVEKMRTVFAKLRSLKNNMFFNTLTDACVSEFE